MDRNVDFLNYALIDISVITAQDVIDASNKLESNLTAGTDGIPSLVVRSLVDPLVHVYNFIPSRVSPILK